MKKLLIFLPCFLIANPHFLVDVNLKIHKQKISFDWKFDKINSTLLFFEADKDKNKKLDLKEENSMIRHFFTSLKKDDYFTMIQQSEEVKILPTNIRFLYIKKRIHVKFDLMIDIFEDMVICNIDPTTYFAFRLKNLSSDFKTNIQKDRYDFCIGIEK